MGDKPTGSLLQAYWATSNRRVILWTVINKFVEEDAKDAAKDNATSSKEKTSSEAKKSNDKSSSKAKSADRTAKLSQISKLVERAKTTDLGRLSPFLLSTQEAMAKQRKVCPMNLRGEVCTTNNCGNKHPKVCIVAAHGKGKIPKATCTLWQMRVPFAGTGAMTTQGNFTGRRSGPNSSPGRKENNNKAKQVRPAKPDMITKLKTKAKELKARIRTAKDQGMMMLQGITYRQVVEGPVVPLQPPVHVAPRAQQQQA
jgi:hypothetical protein